MAKPAPLRLAFRLAAVAALIVVFSLLKLMVPRSNNVGVKEGRLAPCPASPNCVSTQADDAEHRIAPLTFTGTTAMAMFRLKAILSRIPRLKLVKETDNSLHFEATSFFFRFVDDVEFQFDEAAGVIHFRSASRTGHYDFGVNRKRMEQIRAAWNGSATDSNRHRR